MARKNSEDERLDDANMELVISKLSAEKPITKKEACSILNISYNTKRLDTLIETYKEKKERRERMRAAKRGKPATEEEVKDIIGSYLRGSVISELAEENFRTTAFIKKVLVDFGCPIRPNTRDYFSPEMIPEAAERERFAIGEKVYSARYDSLATIKAEFPPNTDSNPRDHYTYRIYLEDDYWLESAYQPAYELASLEHIIALGIRL